MEMSSIRKRKVILIGNPRAGKTSLMTKLFGQSIENVKSTSVSAAFFTYKCKVNDEEVHLNIWDTAGQESYQSVTRVYYRGASCVILAFDITDQESFRSVSDWKKAVEEECPSASIILVANKIDMKENAKVTDYEIKSKSKDIGAAYLIETSALDGTNVQKLFQLSAELTFKSQHISKKSTVTVIKCRPDKPGCCQS